MTNIAVDKANDTGVIRSRVYDSAQEKLKGIQSAGISGRLYLFQCETPGISTEIPGVSLPGGGFTGGILHFFAPSEVCCAVARSIKVRLVDTLFKNIIRSAGSTMVAACFCNT